MWINGALHMSTKDWSVRYGSQIWINVVSTQQAVNNHVRSGSKLQFAHVEAKWSTVVYIGFRSRALCGWSAPMWTSKNPECAYMVGCSSRSASVLVCCLCKCTIKLHLNPGILTCNTMSVLPLHGSCVHFRTNWCSQILQHTRIYGVKFIV